MMLLLRTGPLRGPAKRRGLSLLEVLTALAIFMFSIVVISQMVDSASRTALRAQKLTQAALQCESRMAELVAGVLPMQSTGQVALTEAGEQWSYVITCEPQEWTNVPVDGETIPGLQQVHVTVIWSPGSPEGEIQYTLSRAMLDPRLRVPAAEPTTTSSSSTGSTGGATSR